MIRTLGRGCLILAGLALMAVMALALFLSGAFKSSDETEAKPSTSAEKPRCSSSQRPRTGEAADTARAWALASYCWDTQTDSSVSQAQTRVQAFGPAQAIVPVEVAEQFNTAKTHHGYSVPAVTSLEPIAGDEGSGQITYQVGLSWYWLGESANQQPGGKQTIQVTVVDQPSGTWQVTGANQTGETHA